MRTRVTIAVLAAVLVFYGVFIGWKGVALIATGTVVGVLLGLALIVVPLLGLALVWREITFGRQSGVLAAELESDGLMPSDDLPRRPSGRVDRAAADGLFAQMQAETEASPEDWRAWFRLALAYETAGDRTRARAAARHAIALHGDTAAH